METLKLSGTNIGECAARAAAVLCAGGVILYPTDTLYGLGSDALSDEAVAKIFALKRRVEGKPIHCVVADMEMAEQYAEINETARVLATQFWPGVLTLVLNKKRGVDTGIGRGMNTIGIRIPDNEFCRTLAMKFEKPYTTTSANVSGMETAPTVDDIIKQLGDNARQIDLIIDAGELPMRAPSTVVDLSGEAPVILREGAIPSSDVWSVLHAEE